MLEEGEHKKTVDSMVIVSDKFLEIKKFEEVIGLLRVVLYLQDMGPASEQDKTSLNDSFANAANQDGMVPNGKPQNPVEQQIVWQLEMWKRSEMAKFLAHLKQKEIETIEEVTNTWKVKEQAREQEFNDTVTRLSQFENRLR